MNKWSMIVKRLIILVVLCCVLCALSAFTLPAQDADASYVSAQSLASAHRAEPKGQVSPFSMFMTSSPLSQTARVDATINITFSWGGGGLGTTVFIVDWRDGHTDSYRCGFNCSSGSFTYSHVYTSTGTFVVKGYLDSDPSVATWSTVYSIS